MAEYIKELKGKKMYNQNTLSSKIIIQIERERKSFLDKEKKKIYWPYKKC